MYRCGYDYYKVKEESKNGYNGKLYNKEILTTSDIFCDC